MNRLDELNVAISRAERQLNSAATQVSEGDRTVKRDLTVLAERLASMKAERATLVAPAAPRVRQILTYTPGKGY